MTARDKNIIIALLSLLIMAGVWIWGYSTYPHFHPSPAQVSDTIRIIDTFPRTIPDTPPSYMNRKDTVRIRDPAWMDSIMHTLKVDTAAILADYYAFHNYHRVWEDSLLKVELTDVIAENKPVDNWFRYKILKPQMVINKTEFSYSYSRYLYAGMSLPVIDVRYTDLHLLYAFQKGYIGVGYLPYLKSPTISAGVRIAKFK